MVFSGSSVTASAVSSGASTPWVVIALSSEAGSKPLKFDGVVYLLGSGESISFSDAASTMLPPSTSLLFFKMGVTTSCTLSGSIKCFILSPIERPFAEPILYRLLFLLYLSVSLARLTTELLSSISFSIRLYSYLFLYLSFSCSMKNSRFRPSSSISQSSFFSLEKVCSCFIKISTKGSYLEDLNLAISMTFSTKVSSGKAIFTYGISGEMS